MFERVMITLFCITAFTMLVAEAGTELCLCRQVGGKCLPCTFALVSLRGNPMRVTLQSEAELATLVAAAGSDESREVVEIVGQPARAEVVREKLMRLGLQSDRIKLRSDIDLKQVKLQSEPRNRGDVAAVIVPNP